MKIHNEFSQLSPEWFSFKLGKFGSTDAQALSANGAGLLTLCFEKVAENITGKSKEIYTNEDIERGIELEDLARSAFEIEKEVSVKQVGIIEADTFIVASPDGLLSNAIVEFKCPNSSNFVRFIYEKKIPTQYMWQLQYLMMVAEKEKAYYCIYNEDFSKPLIITEVKRDQEAIDKIQAGLKEGIGKIKEILKAI